MVGREMAGLVILFILLSGLPPAIAFVPAIMWIIIFIRLIVHAFYAGNGKVPMVDEIRPSKNGIENMNVAVGKRHWVHCPSPATSAVPQHAAVLTTPVSSVDEIKKMKELLDCGVITQEEFAAFKKKTLGI